MIRFAQETNTVLFSLDDYIDQGVFALDLNSRQVTKVGETRAYHTLPYMSFYTPGTTCAFL
jgi:Tol biopolymer transport system component